LVFKIIRIDFVCGGDTHVGTRDPEYISHVFVTSLGMCTDFNFIACILVRFYPATKTWHFHAKDHFVIWGRWWVLSVIKSV